ncbi:MAG: hypothetical protein ABIE07_11060 [Candidatus Zixiibacteriota bacterium]
MKNKAILASIIIMAVMVFVSCEREIVGTVELADNASSNCFDCHDYGIDLGTTVKLAMRQYDNSKHASGEAMRSSGSCAACHTTEGFIEKVTGEDITSGDFNAVGCFACHDPHENGDFELRTTATVKLGNGAIYNRGISNLCVQCHKGRRNIETYVADSVKLSSHFGPHYSNQSDMLIGENAYEYAGYDYENSWHSSGVTQGCMKCHYDVSVDYVMGGHTFWMETEEAENTGACNVDGCHINDLEIDDFDRGMATMDFDGDGDFTEGIQTEIEDLTEELKGLLIDAGLLEYIAEDDAWEPTDGLLVPDADSVGAVFNWGFVHEDKSRGIHNTRYAVGLLRSAINYMETGDPEGVPSIEQPPLAKSH